MVRFVINDCAIVHATRALNFFKCLVQILDNASDSFLRETVYFDIFLRTLVFSLFFRRVRGPRFLYIGFGKLLVQIDCEDFAIALDVSVTVKQLRVGLKFWLERQVDGREAL